MLLFTAGAVSLAAEIAAARLLAPYFGASTFIWANVIGVVLISLSVGAWLGGRASARWPTERRLRQATLVAAALLAAVPFAAQPLLRVAAMAFSEIEAGAFLASLAAVLVLVSLPMGLLGAVTPWTIGLVARQVDSLGSLAGRAYALSTAGSLAGTFLSALLLVPALGSQRTFLCCAVVLAAVAAPGLPAPALAAPLALAALIALPPGVTKSALPGERVVHEEETPYQYVRVLEQDGELQLQLNEGRGIHSSYRPETVLTGNVFDGFIVLPLARLGRPPARMAMLGNAAGTVSRAYERFFPQTGIDGVEIDGALSRVGRRYFHMDNPRLRVHTEDARPFLRRSEGPYDLVAVDAYRQPYIPFYLATTEFFRLARSRLTPAGAVIVNVGHPPGDDRLERTLTATLRAVFPHVLRYPIQATSTLLIAARAPLGADRLRQARLPPELRPLADSAAAEIEPALRGGRALTDDRAPVEWLIDASIVEYAAGQ